jgi:hypothetical protein
MKWTEKVIEYKKEQYPKDEVLRYIKSIFTKRKIKWEQRHLQQFETAWKTKVQINPTVEDIVPEVDLPASMLKLTPLQKKQLINVFKNLNNNELKRRKKLLDIALNLAVHRNKKKDVDNFSVISDIIFESRMVKKQKIESAGYNNKPSIKCKRVDILKVSKSELDELRASILKDGYIFVKDVDDFYVYKVSCDGENGIGVGPVEGKVVLSNLKKCDSFHTDDVNVTFDDNYDKVLRDSLKRRKKELSGISPILYHLTEPHKLLSMLEDNRIHMTSNIGTRSDIIGNKKKFKPYYFSMSRVKYGGFNRSFGKDTSVANLVLDGQKLSYKYEGMPVDYWGPEYRKGNDLDQRLRNDENEDRIISPDPYIEPLNKYVKEIHLFADSKAREYYKTGEYTEEGYEKHRQIQKIAALAKSLKIPFYVYIDYEPFKLLDKRRALPNERIIRSTELDELLEVFTKKYEDLSDSARERVYRCYISPDENRSIIGNVFHNAKFGSKSEKLQIDEVIVYMRKNKLHSITDLVSFLGKIYKENKDL